jgi:hypothetical protein
MKKIALLLIALMVGMASFTACKKTCQCKVYVADEVKSQSERPLDKSLYKKCSDMSLVVIIGGKKNGESCQ